MASAAPKLLAAQLGTAAQRELFDMADDLEASVFIGIVTGTYEYGPELFQRSARLE